MGIHRGDSGGSGTNGDSHAGHASCESTAAEVLRMIRTRDRGVEMTKAVSS